MRGTSITENHTTTTSGRQQPQLSYSNFPPRGLTLPAAIIDMNISMTSDLEMKTKGGMDLTAREVSERKQVGDAEGVVNQDPARARAGARE